MCPLSGYSTQRCAMTGWQGQWLEELGQDVRYAIRTLRQKPGFTFAAVGALALGIGANAGVFSAVNAVLLKPLPYPNADRIVQLEHAYGGLASSIVGVNEYRFLRKQSSSIQNISGYWLDHLNLTDGSNPQLLSAALVTGDFFRLYQAPFLQGRVFTGNEDLPNGAHVLILSYEFWSRRFGADHNIVGKTVSLGHIPYVVVAVLGPFAT